jgi:hypothetical protein
MNEQELLSEAQSYGYVNIDDYLIGQRLHQSSTTIQRETSSSSSTGQQPDPLAPIETLPSDALILKPTASIHRAYWLQTLADGASPLRHTPNPEDQKVLAAYFDERLRPIPTMAEVTGASSVLGLADFTIYRDGRLHTRVHERRLEFSSRERLSEKNAALRLAVRSKASDGSELKPLLLSDLLPPKSNERRVLELKLRFGSSLLKEQRLGGKKTKDSDVTVTIQPVSGFVAEAPAQGPNAAKPPSSSLVVLFAFGHFRSKKNGQRQWILLHFRELVRGAGAVNLALKGIGLFDHSEALLTSARMRAGEKSGQIPLASSARLAPVLRSDAEPPTEVLALEYAKRKKALTEALRQGTWPIYPGSTLNRGEALVLGMESPDESREKRTLSPNMQRRMASVIRNDLYLRPERSRGSIEINVYDDRGEQKLRTHYLAFTKLRDEKTPESETLRLRQRKGSSLILRRQLCQIGPSQWLDENILRHEVFFLDELFEEDDIVGREETLSKRASIALTIRMGTGMEDSLDELELTAVFRLPKAGSSVALSSYEELVSALDGDFTLLTVGKFRPPMNLGSKSREESVLQWVVLTFTLATADQRQGGHPARPYLEKRYRLNRILIYDILE